MSKKAGASKKFENNWLSKSLENLEKSVWPPLDPSEDSDLIRTCNALRKKQLKDFTIEDLREMIGQDIGLEYLIPLALEKLNENILTEGDYYEGDLLKSVLTSDKKYWAKEPDNWNAVCELFERNKEILKSHDITWEIKKGWLDSYNEFKSIC